MEKEAGVGPSFKKLEIAKALLLKMTHLAWSWVGSTQQDSLTDFLFDF